MDVGFGELLMLAVLALLIFGPERLPEIARTAGKFVGQVRREATSTFDALKAEVELDELTSFTDDLQRERQALQARSRLDARSLHGRSQRASRADDGDEPPRFDPHAT